MREWEGAAERVLRGFGLSLLVPQDVVRGACRTGSTSTISAASSSTIGCPPTVSLQDTRTPPAEALAHKLDIKDGPFYDWIERELRRRARHVCVDTMDEFRRHDGALTRAGQIKAQGGRHEKDDSHRIDDRRHYVLGWSNEQKIDALLADAQRVQADLHCVDDEAGRGWRPSATPPPRARPAGQAVRGGDSLRRHRLGVDGRRDRPAAATQARTGVSLG